MGLLLEHLWITRLSWKLEIVIILHLFIRCRDLEATGDIRSICHVLGANQFCQYVILHTQNQQCNDKVFYQWLIWTSSYSWENPMEGEAESESPPKGRNLRIKLPQRKSKQHAEWVKHWQITLQIQAATIKSLHLLTHFYLHACINESTISHSFLNATQVPLSTLPIYAQSIPKQVCCQKQPAIMWWT